MAIGYRVAVSISIQNKGTYTTLTPCVAQRSAKGANTGRPRDGPDSLEPSRVRDLRWGCCDNRESATADCRTGPHDERTQKSPAYWP